ncbi:MAG: cell division protein SepF [Clostridiales bacterium]|nr:cell division protein SepF [Clostridiales bacterium]
MARNNVTRGFSRFLDIIGLVDVQPADPADEAGEDRPHRASTGGRTGRSAGPEPRTSASGYRRTEPGRSERTAEGGRYDGYSGGSYSGYHSSGAYAGASRPGSSSRGYERSADRSADRGAADRGAADRGAADREDEFWRSAPSSGRAPAREAPPRETPPRETREPSRPVDVESASYRHQTVIFRLQTFEECRDVILSLIDKKSVLINLDQLEDPLVQRAIDTLGGAAFAIGATMRKASDKTYLIAPDNVFVANNSARSAGPARYM